jgi:hypothetical protein
MSDKGTIYFTKVKSVEPVDLPDETLKNWINKNYTFEAGYIPEGYNVAFLLIEGKDNPIEDSWKIVFFKKAADFSESSSKAITLDNIDELDDVEENIDYQVVKEIETNYEGVIDTSRDLIENYKEEVESKYDAG